MNHIYARMHPQAFYKYQSFRMQYNLNHLICLSEISIHKNIFSFSRYCWILHTVKHGHTISCTTASGGFTNNTHSSYKQMQIRRLRIWRIWKLMKSRRLFCFQIHKKIVYCNVKYLYLLINSKIANFNVYNSCLYSLYHVISIEKNEL